MAPWHSWPVRSKKPSITGLRHTRPQSVTDREPPPEPAATAQDPPTPGSPATPPVPAAAPAPPTLAVGDDDTLQGPLRRLGGRVSRDLARQTVLASVSAGLFGPAAAPAAPRLGAYTLERMLGHGGMGVVHRACGPRGEQVAIKTLRAIDPAAIEQLKHEFRSVADLHHPNLVALHEQLIGDLDAHPHRAEARLLQLEVREQIDAPLHQALPRLGQGFGRHQRVEQRPRLVQVPRDERLEHGQLVGEEAVHAADGRLGALGDGLGGGGLVAHLGDDVRGRVEDPLVPLAAARLRRHRPAFASGGYASRELRFGTLRHGMGHLPIFAGALEYFSAARC